MDNGEGKVKKRTEDGHRRKVYAIMREGLLRLIAVLLSEHA